MIYIAFNPPNVKKLCKTILLFYLTSFVMGGCALALLYMVSPKSIAFKDGVLVGTYPMKMTIIAGIIGFCIIQVAFQINKRQLKKKDMICNLEISINKQKSEVKAYLDSGNTLKDPISKKPVIIVEKDMIKNFSNINLEKLLGGDEENTEKLKLKIIPFNSIGKQNGMLIGVKPDFVKIEYEDKEEYIYDVVIGMYDKKINKDYHALIGLELLEGEKQDESFRNIEQNVRKVHSKR